MVKKLSLGLVLAVASLYGLHVEGLAAHPSVCTGLCLPSSTTVTSSANPQQVGIAVIFKATVVLSSTSTPPPSPSPLPAPSGTVDFSDGVTPIASCQGVFVDSNSPASCPHAFSTPGSHTISASYNGDTVYHSSVGQVVETVTAAPSSFSLDPQSASAYPTAVYSGGSAGPIPSDSSAPISFAPLPTSTSQSTIPYQPTLQANSTAPGSGSNLLALVVIVVVVLLIISAGAITLLLVVK